MKTAKTLTPAIIEDLRSNQTRPLKDEAIVKAIEALKTEAPKFTFQATKKYAYGLKAYLGPKHVCDIWLKSAAYHVCISEAGLKKLPEDTQKILAGRSLMRKDEARPNEFAIIAEEVPGLLADFIAEAPKTEAPKTGAKKTEAPKTGAKKTEAPKTGAKKTGAK